jgi:diguanylate cyclase (GGDEF)-like protein
VEKPPKPSDLKTFKALTQLEKTPYEVIEILQSLIETHIPQILDTFYASAITMGELKPFIEGRVETLKKQQLAHWIHLAKCCLDKTYIEEASHAGNAHSRHSVPVEAYIASYAYMLGELQTHLLESAGAPTPELCQALTTLTSMCLSDIAITMRVYVEEREKHMRFLLGLNRSDEGTLPLNTLIQSFIKETLVFTHFDAAEICTEGEHDLIRSFHMSHHDNGFHADENRKLLPDVVSRRFRMYFQTKPNILWFNTNQINDFMQASKGIPNPSFKTCVVLPLFSQERVIGTLCLFGVDERRKEAQTVNLLNGVVQQLTLLIARHAAQESYHQNLKRLAFYDALTGLPNRALLIDRLEQTLKHTKAAEGQYTGLFFIDIDNFKDINDTLGHTCGDTLLKLFARNLTSYLKPEDTVSRVGGDEFIVLSPFLEGEDHAHDLSQRLFKRCTGLYKLSKTEVNVSVSVGGLVLKGDITDTQQILQKVDIAANHAKKQGKGQVVHFTPQHQQEFLEEKKLIQDIEEALRSHQFCMYYQPIVNTEKATVGSFEALLRWQHPKNGFIPPAHFIPLVEKLPLIMDLGAEVLALCLKDINAFDKGYPNHPSLHVSVNLSAKQMASDEHFQELLKTIDDANLFPGSLRIEITESSFANNIELMRERLGSFKERGIPVLMDDFGTGYSSLSYLKEFNFDFLKMDGSFVKDIELCDKSLNLLKGVIDLAKGQNIQIIAEGVETQNQLNLLQEYGCSLIQGYYFSKPLTFQETSTLLQHCLNTPEPFKDKIPCLFLEEPKTA